MNEKFIDLDYFNEETKNHIENYINENNYKELADLYNSREENE